MELSKLRVPIALAKTPMSKPSVFLFLQGRQQYIQHQGGKRGGWTKRLILHFADLIFPLLCRSWIYGLVISWFVLKCFDRQLLVCLKFKSSFSKIHQMHKRNLPHKIIFFFKRKWWVIFICLFLSHKKQTKQQMKEELIVYTINVIISAAYIQPN